MVFKGRISAFKIRNDYYTMLIIKAFKNNMIVLSKKRPGNKLPDLQPTI